MRAKKSLGQHFLKSEKALASIMNAGKLKPEDVVLEIGPGKGVLTEKLLASGAQVIAVEKDNELFAFLQEKFSQEISHGKLQLVHEDILEFNNSNLKSYKLIANIPYNITGAILEKFLSSDNQPQSMVLLVQKEVAERVCGHLVSTGRGKESILSLSVKVYGVPRYIETVKAGSFVPAPKVDSAIIAINNISKEFFKDFDEEEFFKILKAGFKSRRKKLSSNLSTIFGKNKVQEAFHKSKLDDNTRAEDVSLEIWGPLAQNLIRH